MGGDPLFCFCSLSETATSAKPKVYVRETYLNFP